MKLRPVLLLTGLLGSIPEVLVAYIGYPDPGASLRRAFRSGQAWIPFDPLEDDFCSPPA